MKGGYKLRILYHVALNCSFNTLDVKVYGGYLRYYIFKVCGNMQDTMYQILSKCMGMAEIKSTFIGIFGIEVYRNI